jgi:hypothetical protein
MSIALLDCDNGYLSIKDLSDNGAVQVYSCKTFQDTENVFWAFYRGQLAKPSLVVVDTITALASKTRQDVVLDPASKGANTLWSLGEAAVASQREWGISGDLVVRLLRNIYEMDIPSIFVAHEGERDDPMSGISKKAPDLQKMILSSVVCNADAIVRLKLSSLPIALPDGTIAPPGTRLLLLKPTGDSAVGVRAIRPLPEYIVNPTLNDFVTVLGGIEYFPHNTLLFGAPKSGKTSFACGADRRLQKAV